MLSNAPFSCCLDLVLAYSGRADLTLPLEALEAMGPSIGAGLLTLEQYDHRCGTFNARVNMRAL